MAGGLLEYSGLVTKTKAMRARLLGADDYTAISEYEFCDRLYCFFAGAACLCAGI